MLLLHTRPTVHPVIVTALWRNLQAVTRNERRLAELKSEERHGSNGKLTRTHELKRRNVTDTLGDLLVKAVTGFDEGVELLVGILDHICMQLYAVIHSEWPWNS